MNQLQNYMISHIENYVLISKKFTPEYFQDDHCFMNPNRMIRNITPRLDYHLYNAALYSIINAPCRLYRVQSHFCRYSQQ